ncbi:hypothetical protein JTB14_028738 [Gonioctena quinquepunctata]|nr:hypothetical protein JTB14_028738 [Gonioctena quinquepunctata]
MRSEATAAAEHEIVPKTQLIPKENSLNLEGIQENINLAEHFDLHLQFWAEEVESIAKYFDEQVGADLPTEISKQLNELEKRIDSM